MKKLILVFYAITLWESAFSQQERQVSHYMYDHISVIPGSAGSSDMISTNAIFRQQWPGIEGGPTSVILNLSAPFKIGTSHHGVGFSIWSDELGFNKDIDMSLSYAYQFSVGNGTLGLGISGSFVNREVDGEWIPVQTDPDANIPETNQSEFAFDMGAGLFYRTDELYVGISSTRILENDFEFQSMNSSSTTADKLTRHYYLTAGYNLQLGNPLIEFLPSVFIQTSRITKIDLNATLMYNKKFWGGVSYRIGTNVIGMVGVSILNGVKIGYSYDFDTSSLTNVSKGGHEILLGYSFRVGVEKLPQKYRSIRYL